ncbi:hypothetical protein [Intestinirhabdus alba]|jgi:hypothetical protein|uniref:Uncharacterized protein n=1 Tax=Intestinirhabdus alba TaxID=2899544 RepID=A0A6L6IPT5_9ENTR|nr:hypothetical protein [Intestinirhabdus alba]MTH48851.1 hypothetical protein [Intestinirhabdus alba]
MAVEKSGHRVQADNVAAAVIIGLACFMIWRYPAKAGLLPGSIRLLVS